ncbi:MAG TPA: hypothetical protein P5305_04070 [Rubrivivax sp.]|nr:hypothetical protein [Rubrivivax sp.]HRY87039.1 hypothetical protein [Rubrivivax sp.]
MARRSKENAIDWDAIERQYRLGVKTNKQLGEEFGVDHSSIGRRAKSHGWVADKSKDVDAVTNSLLIQNASGNANPNATPTPLEIKAAAQVNADVVLEHRKDIGRTRALFGRLLAEVELFTEWPAAQELLREMTEIVHGGEDKDGNPKKPPRSINEMLDRVLTGPGRIESAKKLTEILEKLVKLERQAFGIDDEDKGGSDLDRLLLKIERERNGS